MGLKRSLAKRINKVVDSVMERAEERKAARMSKDSARFQQTYSELTRKRFNRRLRTQVTSNPNHECVISDAVDQLRTNGIAVIPGFLSEREVQAARLDMENLESNWHRLFEDTSDRKTIISPRDNGSYVCGNYSQNNRLRVNFQRGTREKAPESIQQLLHDVRLAEIASRYFDLDSLCDYVLAERLGPAPEGDRWHIDRIVDQMKAMILLTDVQPQHGPLRYKTRTHRDQIEMRSTYHSIFSRGIDEAYPDESIVNSIDSEVVYGTGKAGDCIVFDTLGIHSGTQCTADFRQAFVATFSGQTEKTIALQRWTSQAWI